MAATRDAAAVRRVTAGALTGLATITLATGCGGGGNVLPAAEAQVRAVVQRFGAASAGKDYQEICDRLIAKSLSQNVESLGLPCELAFKQGLSSVLGAKLRIDGVRVRGGTAYVDVHSTATNQPPSDDTLKLVRAAGAWRIASLSLGAGPQSDRPAKP